MVEEKKRNNEKKFFSWQNLSRKIFFRNFTRLIFSVFFFSDHVLFYFFDKTTFIFSFVCRSV